MKTKCCRVVSHVLGTAVNGSKVLTTLTEVRAWESQILRLPFQTHNGSRGELGGIQEEDVTNIASQKEGNGLANDEGRGKYGKR